MSFVAAAVVGASVVGGVISSKASSKGANTAAAASTANTAANNAIALQTYGENKATLAPFVQQGGAATSYINQLLGIQTAPAPQQAGGATGGTFAPGSNGGGFNGGFGGGARMGNDFAFNGNGRDLNMEGSEPMFMSGGGGVQPMQPGDGAPMGNGGIAPGTAANAFDAYKNSTGYTTRLQEGTQAVTNNKAVSGLLNSGSALKDLTRFGQDYATGEFSNYLDRLTQQQGVGASAASAQAGVATNYSGQVQGNNSTNATNQGNAAIAKANGVTNAVQGVLSTAGYLAGRKL